MTDFTAQKTQQEAALTGKKEKNSQAKLPGFVNMGFTLLLVVFLVITLVVLALLALSEAKSDLEFSRTLAEERQAYYTACNCAERVLQQVDEASFQARKSGKKPDFSHLNVQEKQGEILWEIPVDESRVLSVAYCLETGEISAWKIQSARQWSQDEEVSVWTPSER